VSVFAKLNLKDQRQILVLDAPVDFEAAMAALADVTVVRVPQLENPSFVLAFALELPQVERAAEIASGIAGDPIVWVAYPKQSSKRYRCGFNRDNGWESFGAAGFEPVRQVAVDADWSALRFRRVGAIKQLTRSSEMALTDEGKRRGRTKVVAAD
jgi:hypothetical protein